MSSIARPRRIDRDRIVAAFPPRRIAIVLSAVMFTVLIVSFRPFQPAGPPLEDGASAGGDIVNQLGFGSLGALALFALFTFVHVYLVVYHDYVEGHGGLSSIIGGWKFMEKHRAQAEQTTGLSALVTRTTAAVEADAPGTAKPAPVKTR